MKENENIPCIPMEGVLAIYLAGIYGGWAIYTHRSTRFSKYDCCPFSNEHTSSMDRMENLKKGISKLPIMKMKKRIVIEDRVLAYKITRISVSVIFIHIFAILGVTLYFSNGKLIDIPVILRFLIMNGESGAIFVPYVGLVYQMALLFLMIWIMNETKLNGRRGLLRRSGRKMELMK
jgi:hypothetical protein